MNITEAHAVNTVLRHLLGLSDAWDPDGLDDREQKARDAAVLLADRANKALGAGLHGHDVEQAWDDLWAGPWADADEWRLRRHIEDVDLPEPEQENIA